MVLPRRSRPEQMNEINLCERIYAMEKYLRIDCFESAIPFVLCFNFDGRKKKEETHKKNDRRVWQPNVYTYIYH